MLNKIPFKEISRIHKECPVCDNEKDLAYGETTEILKVRGEGIEVTSKIYFCLDGGHYFYDIEDEEDKFQSAYRQYKRRKGLLQSEEIKAIRNQYGLSQKNFARLLNWGDITIHRYETGAIQDDVHNDVLTMLRDFDYFKKYFETKRNILEPDLVRLVQQNIDSIEQGLRRHTADLMIKMLAEQKREFRGAFIGETQPDYIRQGASEGYCSNEELALAA